MQKHWGHFDDVNLMIPMMAIREVMDLSEVEIEFIVNDSSGKVKVWTMRWKNAHSQNEDLYGVEHHRGRSVLSTKVMGVGTSFYKMW